MKQCSSDIFSTNGKLNYMMFKKAWNTELKETIQQATILQWKIYSHHE
jgi:hypothetical protein